MESESAIVSAVTETLAGVLPSAALHFVAETERKLPWEVLVGHGLNDSTIKDRLEAHGVNISEEIRLRLLGTLNFVKADSIKTADELYLEVKDSFGGLKNPFVPSVRILINDLF
jgi:hypothetical protein